MLRKPSFTLWALVLLTLGQATISGPASAQDALVEEVATAEEAFTKAFNEAKPDALVESFLPEGELVTENGSVYRGKEELKGLFTQYFTEFPGAKLGLDIESIRPLGENLVIEEGTRYLGINDQPLTQVRYVATLMKKDGKWLLASLREFYSPPAETPGSFLEPMAWMVGDWVSEGNGAKVKINYRWSEGGNYLLGTFETIQDDQVAMKSEQRIGYDPLTGKIRSWLFDEDGGYADGYWTLLEDEWVLKSQAVGPDGTVGFATITVSPLDENRFRMVGSDRVVGDQRIEGFDIVIAKAPPQPVDEAGDAPAPAATPAPAAAAARPTPAQPPVAKPAAQPAAVQPAAPKAAPAPAARATAPTPAAPKAAGTPQSTTAPRPIAPQPNRAPQP